MYSAKILKIIDKQKTLSPQVVHDIVTYFSEQQIRTVFVDSFLEQILPQYCLVDVRSNPLTILQKLANSGAYNHPGVSCLVDWCLTYLRQKVNSFLLKQADYDAILTLEDGIFNLCKNIQSTLPIKFTEISDVLNKNLNDIENKILQYFVAEVMSSLSRQTDLGNDSFAKKSFPIEQLTHYLVTLNQKPSAEIWNSFEGWLGFHRTHSVTIIEGRTDTLNESDRFYLNQFKKYMDYSDHGTHALKINYLAAGFETESLKTQSIKHGLLNTYFGKDLNFISQIDWEHTHNYMS